MTNLELYNKLSVTPNEARKEISAGRLRGMTDINPMWRIKSLTEAFGICGIGWKYVITSKRLETGCKGQISAFVDIDLFIKVDGVWSDAIQGTGGASFVTEEKNGLYQNDECFKMALTDAIGIACKALGMSADIYFSKDRTKYDIPTNDVPKKTLPELKFETPQYKQTYERVLAGTVTIEKVKEYYTLSSEVETALKSIIKASK